MNVPDLLSQLQGRGFTLAVDGESLLVNPASRLTATERGMIRETKTALVALLLLRQFEQTHTGDVGDEDARWLIYFHARAEWHCQQRLTVSGQPTGEAFPREFHAGRSYNPDAARAYANTPEAAPWRAELLRCADAAERTPPGKPLMLPKVK